MTEPNWSELSCSLCEQLNITALNAGSPCASILPRYPDLTTYEGMGLLIAAMRKDDKFIDCISDESEDMREVWRVFISGYDTGVERAYTLPQALMLAAAAALGIETVSRTSEL